MRGAPAAPRGPCCAQARRGRSGCWAACPGGRGDGRGVSGSYGGRDEMCPISTGAGRGVSDQYGGQQGRASVRRSASRSTGFSARRPSTAPCAPGEARVRRAAAPAPAALTRVAPAPRPPPPPLPFPLPLALLYAASWRRPTAKIVAVAAAVGADGMAVAGEAERPAGGCTCAASTRAPAIEARRDACGTAGGGGEPRRE
jgi:hypothetical protein